MTDVTLPSGWTRWHSGTDGTVIWTFRPDIFDGASYPAACLPTVTVKRERHRGPRGRPRSAGSGAAWCAELRLEPDVLLERRTVPDRADALDAAWTLADAFSSNEFSVVDVHHDERHQYLQKLGELLPTDSSDSRGLSEFQRNE